MNRVEELCKPIVVDAVGLTIGGERVPGAVIDDVIVEDDREIPGFWRVTATFLTNVYPMSDTGTVDEPVNTRVIRPARPGDLD